MLCYAMLCNVKIAVILLHRSGRREEEGGGEVCTGQGLKHSRICKCCCGLHSEHIGFTNVAVTFILGTLDVQMLLWHTFCAPWICKCSCGAHSEHIGCANSAVAFILGILDLQMLLWLAF